MDRAQLMYTFMMGLEFNPKGCQSGYILSIEREDGSGYNFNIKLRHKDNTTSVVFFQCVRPK